MTTLMQAFTDQPERVLVGDQNIIHVDGETFSQRFRKCGRSGCKCENGSLHGPYWYKNDRYGSLRYVGKDLPGGVLARYFARREHYKAIEQEKQVIRREIEELERAVKYASRKLHALSCLQSGDYVDTNLHSYLKDAGFGDLLPDQLLTGSQPLLSALVGGA